MSAPPHVLKLRLRNLAQLFNSMDPSPFIERDLDADAEEFIASWARELPAGGEGELAIHLTDPTPAENAAAVGEAVRAYFATRAVMKGRELNHLLKRGRLSLIVGTSFLVTCLILGELVGKIQLGTATDILREGLTIVGWVAMWRPLEIYLYDWWPLFEERRRLELLSRLRVTFAGEPGSVPDSVHPGRRVT